MNTENLQERAEQAYDQIIKEQQEAARIQEANSFKTDSKGQHTNCLHNYKLYFLGWVICEIFFLLLTVGSTAITGKSLGENFSHYMEFVSTDEDSHQL